MNTDYIKFGFSKKLGFVPLAKLTIELLDLGFEVCDEDVKISDREERLYFYNNETDKSIRFSYGEVTFNNMSTEEAVTIFSDVFVKHIQD